MYKLKADRFEHKAGTMVYEYRGHDYGCARDDEFITQKPHSVVTLDINGGTPFFTVPSADLEAL